MTRTKQAHRTLEIIQDSELHLLSPHMLQLCRPMPSLSPLTAILFSVFVLKRLLYPCSKYELVRYVPTTNANETTVCLINFTDHMSIPFL